MISSKCNKRKLSLLEAKIRLAIVSGDVKRGRLKYKECRIYYCKECKSYHTTSKKREGNIKI